MRSAKQCALSPIHGLAAKRYQARHSRGLGSTRPNDGSAFTGFAALKNAGDDAQSKATPAEYEDAKGNPHPVIVRKLVAGLKYCAEDLKHGFSPDNG
jgi:hypothetical protein